MEELSVPKTLGLTRLVPDSSCRKSALGTDSRLCAKLKTAQANFFFNLQRYDAELFQSTGKKLLKQGRQKTTTGYSALSALSISFSSTSLSCSLFNSVRNRSPKKNETLHTRFHFVTLSHSLCPLPPAVVHFSKKKKNK